MKKKVKFDPLDPWGLNRLKELALTYEANPVNIRVDSPAMKYISNYKKGVSKSERKRKVSSL